MEQFRKVLFVDGSPRGSTRGFASALDVARAHGARLTVAAVVPPRPGSDAGPPLTPGAALRHEEAVRTWRVRLDELAARGRSPAGAAVEARVLEGRWPAAVCRAAGEHDLVMKVAGEPPWPGGLDPDDRDLLRTSPRPVWILGPARSGRFEVVVAAVDVAREGSDRLNASVVRLAASLADAAGARLRVVHAWSVPGESVLASPLRGVSRRRLRSVLTATREDRRRRVQELLDRTIPGRSVSVSMPKERPIRAIRREARLHAADVVVVGNTGRTGPEAWLLGNVAEALVGHVPGSVLAVGHDDAGVERPRHAERRAPAQGSGLFR